MRKNKLFGAEEEENEINLTPMLDVVFIMLIFFIVTASFIKEAGIDVDRPDAPSADSQDDAAILIAISANDEIWIDRRETEPNAVRGMIERLHAENPKGSIVIQADEESTHEVLVVVMEAAKQAGVDCRVEGLGTNWAGCLSHCLE
jgi:biopolymer transport protein ExbD